MHAQILKPLPGVVRTLLTLRPGQFSSNHFHRDNEEVYLILEGEECRITLNKSVKKFNAGDDIHIPKGVHHQIHNLGRKVVKILSTKTQIDPDDPDYHLV